MARDITRVNYREHMRRSLGFRFHSSPSTEMGKMESGNIPESVVDGESYEIDHFRFLQEFGSIPTFLKFLH